MLTADIQVNEFNRGLNRLATRLGLDAKRMMQTELGQLVKTLVKISPPEDRNKSMRNVRAKVNKRFEKLGQQSTNFLNHENKASKSGLKYYAANSDYLFAGASDADMTNATVKQLRAIYYASRKLQGSYRIVAGFKNRNTSQRVAISTRILAKDKQVKEVGDKIAYNFGRLKAGWLSPVKAGVVNPGGRFPIPKWVKNHMFGARGRFLNGLDNPQNPNFTIINFAKGAAGKASKRFVKYAMSIRAKAMKENARQILSGKKEYKYAV